MAMHVDRQAASTQTKYRVHIKDHIRPAFGKCMPCDLQPLMLQPWLDGKEMSWATKTDLRNIQACSQKRSNGASGKTPILSPACTLDGDERPGSSAS